MTFNDKIDNFMEQNGYDNLKQLSSDCGIPYTTLKDFYDKKSANNSRLSTISKLSKFMKCTMDYLAYDEILNPNETLSSYVKKSIYSKKITDEDGYSIEIKTEIPFNELPKEKQQDMIDTAMEKLFEVKKEIKEEKK